MRQVYEGDRALGDAFCIQDSQVCCVAGRAVHHCQHPAVILAVCILARHKDGLLAKDKTCILISQRSPVFDDFSLEPRLLIKAEIALMRQSTRTASVCWSPVCLPMTHLSKAVTAGTPQLLPNCAAVPGRGAPIKPPVQGSAQLQHHLPHTTPQ